MLSRICGVTSRLCNGALSSATGIAPSCTFAVGTDVRSGWIGLPVPGVEVKLVLDPSGDPLGKTEIRFRGPNVMPGYWRAPNETNDAFDDEGFYKTGDAVKFVDAVHPVRGLMFDGRIAEDFKLSSGTFVSVGPLKARIVHAGDPCVLDAVIAQTEAQSKATTMGFLGSLAGAGASAFTGRP